MKPQNIIVIHPGSSNLRIGRASDSNPHCIFNAIARKRRPTGISYRDNFLPECVEKVKKLRIFDLVSDSSDLNFRQKNY